MNWQEKRTLRGRILQEALAYCSLRYLKGRGYPKEKGENDEKYLQYSWKKHIHYGKEKVRLDR